MTDNLPYFRSSIINQVVTDGESFGREVQRTLKEETVSLHGHLISGTSLSSVCHLGGLAAGDGLADHLPWHEWRLTVVFVP